MNSNTTVPWQWVPVGRRLRGSESPKLPIWEDFPGFEFHVTSLMFWHRPPLSLCRRGAQGRSGEKPSQCWWSGGHVLPLKPAMRSVAAPQDTFQRWWASSLSTLAHVKRCGKLRRTAGAAKHDGEISNAEAWYGGAGKTVGGGERSQDGHGVNSS